MKRLLMIFTSALLCMTMLVIGPAQVLASAADDNEQKYISEVKIGMGETSEQASKELLEMTRLLDELRFMLTTEQQKEKLEQIENCQLSLIALSEKDAYIEGFRLGTKMSTEIYTDTQQRK